MGVTAYKATGLVISAVSRLLGVQVRVTGTENLLTRPTLFVANHFTRIETFLVPWVIYRYAGRTVRCLGTYSVFTGMFGRYFEALGGMSTRDPRRNRTIIRELMTGHANWMIYPEGGLIKNKKMIRRGRLHLDHPERLGPPHTGAAMLALKAEMCKRRYLEADRQDEPRRVEYYQEAFGLTGTDEVCEDGIVIQPVTLTFYPMRPSRNLINRVAKFFVHDLDPRIDEELQVEGSILLRSADVCVHFGQPIEVSQYLGKVTALARRVAGIFSEDSHTDLFLRQQARRLTDVCMRSIYNNVEISFDHLLCYGLRVFEGDRIQIDDLRGVLYLAATELCSADALRLHPTLRNGITSLVTGQRFGPWDEAIELALKEGVLQEDGDDYVINRVALQEGHDFHNIRLEKMMQVIANELEPVKPAVDVVRRMVNLPAAQLRKLISAALHRREVERFEQDYAAAFTIGESKPRDLGEPFFLEARNARAGVVLVHGYLASPEQVRPFAEFLRDQGFSVYAVRLAAHGTAPDQLAGVRWQQWMDSVLRGHALMRRHCDTVIAGGFSLGGILSLHLAAMRPESVGGVFSINAPMKLADRRAPLIGPLVRAHGFLRRLGLANGHYRLSNEGTESPEINYRTDDLRAVRELRRAVESCRRTLGEVTAPALVIQSDTDPLVVPGSARRLLAGLGSDDKVLIELPFDHHLIVRGEGSQTVFEAVGRFINRLLGVEEALAVPVEAPPPAINAAANPEAETSS